MPSAFQKLIAISITGFVLNSTASVRAQTPSFPWEGEVSGSNVYVRSGAGANWYPTTKLNAGDRVLVLGDKFGWYQITPPQGSFSYIDMAMVERKAGEKTGVVKQDKVYVRAGSALEQRKSATQVVLNKGSTVEILGEAQGFFKVTPPPGATLYISKQYVKPVEAKLTTGMVERYLSNSPPPATDASAAKTDAPSETPPIEPAADGLEPSTSGDATQMAQGASPDSIVVPPPINEPTTDDPGAALADPTTAAPAGADTTTPPGDKPAVTPATKTPPVQSAQAPVKKIEPVKPSPSAAPAGKVEPAANRYQAMLTMCESELVSLLSKPLEEQDASSLIKRYEEIASQKAEYIPAEVAKIRARQLKNRMKLRDEHLALRPIENDLAQYRANMDAERMRIMREKTEQILETYDLEGELRRSLAFGPETRRFRLVDPATESTVAYVDIPRSVDENPEHLIGRFVGIRAAGKTFSPSARVPIAVAGKVVDLTQRKTLMETGASQSPTAAETSDEAQDEPPAEPRKTASTDDIGE